MSLPLWEECAWYVDIPEPELELTEPAEAPEDAFGGVDEDYSAEINIDITSDAGDAVESTAVDASTLESEFQAALGGYVADAADAVPDEISEALPDHQESEQVPDADDEVTSHAAADHGETTEDAEVEQSEHAVDAADETQEFEEDEQNFDISVNIVDEDGEPVEEPVTYRFPINKHINKRMYLYLGEIYKLPCDAIVVGQVENLRDRLDGNDVIFTLAGIELEPELAQLAPCTTGDCVVTKGWQMPCEWIIHAVGPKYDARYLEASDHALFSAYKKSLLLAAEKEVQSLVLGTIYKQSKNYPRFDAAHVALRTVRKFLEHSVGDIFDRVMFCVNTQEDFEIYSALMHAYFPRTQEELEDQANLLPIELGDEWGEIIIPDRVVKVSVGPKPLPVESLQQYKGASEEAKDTTPGGAAAAGPKKLGTREIKAIGEGPPRAMTQSDQDPDYERRRKVNAEFAKMSREERLRLRFQAMVRDLDDEEDLDDLDALQLIHIFGKDHKERTVVFLSGANLMRAERMEHDRVLKYLLKRMEPLRCVPFVLIYGCGTLGDERYPDTNFMQSVFDLYACRYNDTLMKFYIMHASFSFRIYFWLLLPLETTTFWSSYTTLTNIDSMRHYMDVASLDIPTELVRYDRDNYA